MKAQVYVICAIWCSTKVWVNWTNTHVISHMVKVHDISTNIDNRLQDLGGSKYMCMPFVARCKYKLKICSYVDIIKTMHYIPIVNSKFLTIINRMFHNISNKKSSIIIFVTIKLVLGSRPRPKSMRGEFNQKSVSGFKHTPTSVSEWISRFLNGFSYFWSWSPMEFWSFETKIHVINMVKNWTRNILLKKSWSVNIESVLTFFIWKFEVGILVKRLLGWYVALEACARYQGKLFDTMHYTRLKSLGCVL